MLAVGCSYTVGHGLKYEKDDPELWVNRLAKSIDAEVTNRSKTGANNQYIFLETMSELIRNEYDIVVVGWSAIPRFNFHVGLELYEVSTMLNTLDVNIVGGETIPGSWLNDIGNRLLRIHNDHWDLLALVKYVNIIIEMQEITRAGKVVFVNGLGPWTSNYFEKKQCCSVPLRSR